MERNYIMTDDLVETVSEAPGFLFSLLQLKMIFRNPPPLHTHTHTKPPLSLSSPTHTFSHIYSSQSDKNITWIKGNMKPRDTYRFHLTEF